MNQAVPMQVPDLRRIGRNGALLLASFGALLAFLDVTIVNVAFPSIQASFPHSSYGDLSWVLNSYNIVFAAVLVAAGRLADVAGRRRTFAFGVLVLTVASVLCAAAPTVGVLVAARVVQAVGAGLLVPASLGLVVEAFPIERRAHAITAWGATAALASGLGPPLGGALVELQGWRLAFLVNLPLGVVALALIGRTLVESRAPGRRRLPDLRGAALLGLATASVTLGVVQGSAWGWTSARVLSAFVLAPVLAAGFVWSSRRHPAPVLDPDLLRIRSFAVGNVVTFFAGMGFYAYMLNNILWLHYVWGYQLLRAGLAVAPGALVAAVVAAVLGRVVDKHGYRVVAVPGALIWSGAYVWYITVVGTSPAFLSQWLPGQVLSGIGVGATLPIVASAALQAVPGGRYATASAVVSSTRQLGAVIGIAGLVVLVGSPSPAQAADAFRSAWWLSVVCFAVVAAGSLGLRHQEQVLVEDVAPPGAPELQVTPLRQQRRDAEVDHESLLSALPAGVRRRLLDESELVTVDGGQWLFQAGDPTDALYVVSSGRLDVVGDAGVIRELVAGDVVGELGVLTGAMRSAGIRARRDSVLWRITPAAFDTALRRDVGTLQALTRTLAERLQTGPTGTPAQALRPPVVVAVVGIGDGAPVQEVADALQRELSATLRVLVRRAISAEELQNAERVNDRVVLVSGDPHKRFHRFCLRQADRVVVVAAAGSAPPADLGDLAAGCYLLLVGNAPPADRLVAWHDALAPRFAGVAAGAGDDVVASIGRRLAGRSIGVAIAGGGARSFSAIGVVEELQRAGIRIDRYAGCSIGSAVAAMYAQGRNGDAVDAALYEEFVRRNPYNDYRIPTVSLSRGRKTEAGLIRQFGDQLFEQLPHELILVSTDLLNRQLVLHRRGLVRDAVRASFSLPGLYAPARMGDSLHVDGGVLDNLPIRALADADEGPVVAVNIAAAAPLRERTGPPRMPSLGETLLRTILMGGTTALSESKARATVVVTPDTRGIGLLEFHQIDRARESGRVAGRAAAAALQEQLAAAIPLPRDEVINLVVPAPRSSNGRVRQASSVAASARAGTGRSTRG